MMNRKIYSLIVALSLVLSMFMFASCGSNSTSESTKESQSESESVIKKYTLTVENGTGSGEYTENTNVTVNAYYDGDYVTFGGWELGGEIVSDKEEYTFKITENTSIKAVYESTLSVWDGTVPATAPATYVVDDVNYTVDINDAAALLYWRSLLTSGKTNFYNKFSALLGGHGYTININSDMDLSKGTWDGIDDENPILDGSTINGNGHTLLGMYTIGKKNLQDDTTWRGVPSGGFFTMIGGAQTLTIKNLTFDDARVDNYNGQLGVLAGIVYNATVNIENVHVINSTVDGGTSHKVGGLIGRVGMMERTAEHNPAIEKVTVSNCSVENTTITGMRNMAGLVGIVFSSYGVHIYNTWKDKNGQTLLAGFRAFEGQTTSQIVTWLSDCVSYMQSIVDGKTENNTGLSTSELNAKISEYQGDITGFGIDMVVTFDKSYVTNCTFISLIARTEKDASGSIKDQTNVATLYNFDDADVWYLNYDVKSFYQDDVYDNTNTIINLRVWNTQEELDGTIANPVSISKASYIEQMMKDFYTAEGNMDATEVAGYLNKTFVVTTVIDCTSIFEGNAEASSIVLPEGMKIVLAPGAKLIGIPESVLANVKIVNWCGIVTEPDTNQLLK